ncbi:hypothetical protein CVT26_008718 [Gymnopilus dilepis]|uniref:DUF4218 domain-containing protein n=1 Tax=Gymnopilus dilepis TaxID=231916 RepID=A0A409YGD5_9AGAR|nr:hypothetical protein CVT26_008718 [Gymnopilus dilepis]
MDTLFNLCIYATLSPLCSSPRYQLQPSTDTNAKTGRLPSEKLQTQQGKYLTGRWISPGIRSPRVETYQHMVNSRLHKLSLIEKKVLEFISSTEPQVLNIGTPRDAEEVFPLYSAMASIRQILHELAQVSSRNPAIQEAKASISDSLYELNHRLRSAQKQWKASQSKLPRVYRPGNTTHVYDAGKHIAPILDGVHPVIQASVFTMVVLQVVLHLSRRGCRFFLAMVYYIIQLVLLGKGLSLSIEDQKLLSDFPKDPETAMKQFLLEGNEVIYAVCPKASCQKLYAPRFVGTSPIPQYQMCCSHCELHDGNECGTRLTRPRFFGETQVEVPIKQFVAFSFKEYVASLTSRVGFEDCMDNATASTPHNGAPMRDVFDGQFLRNFLGPDGKLFASNVGTAGRYSFSLGFDFFNPLTNKQSGKKVSFGVISVVCLNLPLHLRYKPENMFLAGVIPGPNEPPLTAANHYLTPIIDEFLEFWEPGVHFSRTAKFPGGRLILCALILVVCDLPAARKISGFASPKSEHFCNICHCRLSRGDLQTTDVARWKERTDKEYRDAMDEYQAATTAEKKEDEFKTNGIRYSELRRLTYFKMIECVVVDPAHNHFLGLINEHFTSILGIQVRPIHEKTAIEIKLGRLPENMAQNVIVGVEKVKVWLQSPFSTTFGQTRDQGVKKLMRVNADALQFICSQIRCPLPTLPENRKRHSKQDYCESILSWREAQCEVRDTGAATSTLCGHVLQAGEMSAIWSDLEQMLTPSWVTSVPSRLGQPSHGKLKADQWRVLGTTHLAISLVRLWALTETNDARSRRCYELLHVTQCLISAIIVASSHTVTTGSAETYLTYMLEYLNGIKRLFPEYRLKPNHHMALHVHKYLLLFGPMHSWWTFPFERLVGGLQRVPHNGKPSEMEGTIARAYTRMGNLQRLISKPGCPEVIHNSRPFFEALFFAQQREKLRVTVCPDLSGFDCQQSDNVRECVLPPDLRFALLRADLGGPSRAHMPSHIMINGMRYTTSSKHPGNACIMVMLPNVLEPVPAQLVYIGTPARHHMMSMPYLARHSPTITNRIKFQRIKLPPLPDITVRTNFAGKWLAESRPDASDTVRSSATEMLGTDSDLSSEVEDETDQLYDDEHTVPYDRSRKIPKPQGEPGRPRSGGYTLSKVLKAWGDEFKVISAFIKDEADKMLDTSLSYKSQPQSGINSICELATARFPILNKYEDNWPVRDILKAHIKYRCTKRGIKGKQKST